MTAIADTCAELPNPDPLEWLKAKALHGARVRDQEGARVLLAHIAAQNEELKDMRGAVLELQRDLCAKAGVPMPSERPVVDKLRERVRRLEEALCLLRKFVQAQFSQFCDEEAPEGWREMAVKHGIIHLAPFDPAEHVFDEGSAAREIGEDWYVLTDAARAALDHRGAT